MSVKVRRRELQLAMTLLHRAARLKALGNSVVPAQAYPFFEAIAIMEEVRTQCNTASST